MPVKISKKEKIASPEVETLSPTADPVDESPKTPVKTSGRDVFVDIAVFIYKGPGAYFHHDEKGNFYTFKAGDRVFIHEGETSRYFDYKQNAFQRVKNEERH